MGTAADSPTWYQRFTAVERDEGSELYRALADERRRAILSVLPRSDTPLSESQLARFVAARENEDSPNSVTSVDCERIQVSLHHVHLPHLEAAGLIERGDADQFDCTQHPFWTNSDVRTLLTRDRVAPDVKSTLFELLAVERRRAVLTLLKDQQELTVKEIADELTETPLTGQDLPKVRAELLHSHIPKLEDAGVVAVDSTGDAVRYTGNAVLEEWFSAVRTHQEE